MINILLTGGSGFIGTSLKARFSSTYNLILPSRKDLYNPDLFDKVDIVIHLAGKAHDISNVSNNADYEIANTTLTNHLFDNFLKCLYIYQKIYTNDLEKYLSKNGFTKYLLKNNFNDIRANPDLDNWVYKNKNNEIMIAKYFDDCKTLFDINIYPINKYIYEHPFEFMAYDLQDKIMKL